MNHINCPNCNHSFDVEQVLANKVQEELKKEYQEKAAAEALKLNAERLVIEQEREKMNKFKANEKEIFEEILKKRLEEESQKIEKKTAEAFSAQLKALEEENHKKQQENRALLALEVELRKKELSLKEQAEDMNLMMQKQLLEKQAEIEENIKKKEREHFELERREWQEKLHKQKLLAEEQVRKATQGSMQTQGETLELAIEDYLKEKFALDQIEEIKKGARGADCLQTVNTRTQLNCGTIYYESKRTKDFQPSWIEKFKQDIRDKGADIGVLVTETMPKDMERMGLYEGIWICNFDEFKGLSAVLRETIIKLSTAVSAQENKGDKMGMLYDYLTSPTFKSQIEAIVEAFTAMKNGLEKEKRAMNSIWKEREKQIEKVIGSTTDLYGTVRGIAGNQALTIGALELGYQDENEE
jgi:hypothetical protein